MGENFFQFARCYKKLPSFRNGKEFIYVKSKLKFEIRYY